MNKSDLALLVNRYQDRIQLVLYNPEILLSKLEQFLDDWNNGEQNYDLIYNMKTDVFDVECIAAHIIVRKPGYPCNGALEVIESAGVAGSGFGRYAYNLIMGFNENGGIMSDRTEVSEPAKQVWKNYYDGDADKQELDDVINPQTPDPSDDCDLYGDEKFLDYSYDNAQEDSTPHIAKHKIFSNAFMRISKEAIKNVALKQDDINSALLKASRKFFTQRLNGG